MTFYGRELTCKTLGTATRAKVYVFFEILRRPQNQKKNIAMSKASVPSNDLTLFLPTSQIGGTDYCRNINPGV